jgi:hypothetical protein
LILRAQPAVQLTNMAFESFRIRLELGVMDRVAEKGSAGQIMRWIGYRLRAHLSDDKAAQVLCCRVGRAPERSIQVGRGRVLGPALIGDREVRWKQAP